jgi:hypothetical protein
MPKPSESQRTFAIRGPLSVKILAGKLATPGENSLTELRTVPEALKAVAVHDAYIVGKGPPAMRVKLTDSAGLRKLSVKLFGAFRK